MKKTLGVLLAIPFAVAILGFVNIAVMSNVIEVDISGINWNYRDNEGFRISENGYLLEATPVVDENYALAEGNDLIWYVSSFEGENSPAEVYSQGESYYLRASTEGSATITCSNEKGNVRRSFEAYCYENGAVVLNNTELPSSGASMSSKRKFGTLDVSDDGRAVTASFALEFEVYGSDEEAVVSAYSSNLSVSNGRINIHSGGDSYVTYRAPTLGVESTYSFYAVEGAINVKDYDDLLFATNQSETGYPVCLQRNLLSLRETYRSDSEGHYVEELLSPNTRLFGNFDFASQSFSFDEEIYRFTTTYNHEFLDQLIEEGSATEDERTVKTGIRLRHSLFGNGYSINMHELCYPRNGDINDNGILAPGEGDLFDGPLYYVTVGPTTLPFVAVYGQDNSGLYVEGSNLVVEDLNIQNISDTDNLYDLTYVGSVIDVKGENVSINNCLIHNGRVGVRAYGDGFELNNCYVYRAREFLLKLGSDEYLKTDENKNVSFTGPVVEGTTLTANGPISSVLGGTGSVGDNLWTSAVLSGNSSYVNSLRAVQNGLDNTSRQTPYQMEVNDCVFSSSGLFSIAFDALFNGAYLYNGTPSGLFSLVGSVSGLVTIPDNIGGTSRPVHLTMSGDCRFYDYKTVSSLDPSCLIEQNLGQLLNPQPSIDDYFPMRRLLASAMERLRYSYREDLSSDDPYINPILGYYGGGYNGSSVDYSGITNNHFGQEIEIDYAASCFTSSSGNRIGDLLSHAVPMAAGMNPFRFVTTGTYSGTPYLYGETPSTVDIYSRGGSYETF